MKKSLFVIVMLALAASQAFGQAWVPTPLVIDVPDVVSYPFDGSAMNITFDTTGKPGMIYMVVNTMLDDEEKPVAVQNGFKGWHYVNGIDTTIYVSSGREYTPGMDQMFPWDGHGNENEYGVLVDSGAVAPGTYSYYLVGYDNKNTRETACFFLNVGEQHWPTGDYFYSYDDETGAKLNNPLVMGITSRMDYRGVSDRTDRLPMGTLYKWVLGSDPYDDSLLETSYIPYFEDGDFVPDMSYSMGPSIADPNDYDTFYLGYFKYWDNLQTAGKFSFVPGGLSVEDLSWGGFDNVSWWFIGQETENSMPPTINDDGEYIYLIDVGDNMVTFPVDLTRRFPYDDPTDNEELVNIEWYAADPPSDATAIHRSAEARTLTKSQVPGQFYRNGDASCLTVLYDTHKIFDDGAEDPYGDEGYIVWGNSNGDFFGDKGIEAPADNPGQLWACHAYEPRNYWNLRKSASPSDMNNFMYDFLDYAGLYSGLAYTQDGSAIDYWQFADAWSSGGDNRSKKGNGTTYDMDTIYDGIYCRYIRGWEDGTSGMNLISWDSDGGIITSEDVAVEDDAPAAFSVAQNAPNPFNPSTTISFSLAQDGQVSIDVYNVAGQKVDTLVNDFMTSGSHSVIWDASGFSAGVYFYTVTSGDFTKTMKMTLLK
jgi:hypothetical protein